MKIWALARLTLLEAARRRSFLILALFAGALLISAAILPSLPPEVQLKFVEKWALTSIGVFTAIAVLFLAAFSLPGDYEHKRIYLLVAKPLSKPVLFLGKFLGFTLLLALFVAGMGILSLLYLRTIKALGSEQLSALVAYPRAWASDFTHEGGKKIAGDRVAITPPGDNRLIWRFRGLRPPRAGEALRLEVRLHLAAPGDEFRASGSVRFTFRSPSSGRSKAEDRVLNTNEETDLPVPAELIDADGRLDLSVSRLDADGSVAASRTSAVILEPSANFEINFLRGLGLIFFQSLLVLSLTLMGSTCLSAPVSILLGILLYIVGNMHSFVLEGARDIDHSLSLLNEAGAVERTPEDLPAEILEISSKLSQAVLAVVPDFSTFDFGRWLLKDRAISLGEIAAAGLSVLPHVVVLAVLGMLVMRFKDFG